MTTIASFRTRALAEVQSGRDLQTLNYVEIAAIWGDDDAEDVCDLLDSLAGSGAVKARITASDLATIAARRDDARTVKASETLLHALLVAAVS